jgi:hypothetical protein
MCSAIMTIAVRSRYAGRFAIGIVVLVLWSVMSLFTQAQSWVFGSRDDPAEHAQLAWWNAYVEVTGAAGFSLIGPQWRGVGQVDLAAKGPGYGFRLDGSLRSGIYGPYDVETDEWRDVLRMIDHIRYRPEDSGTYLRLGPLDRTRFGNGHLVNFFSTETVWDDRSIGAEVQFSGRYHTLEAFTADVTRRSISGVRLAMAPFDQGQGGLSSLEVSGAVVEDHKTDTDLGSSFRGFETDVRMRAYRSGSFDFVPFVSGAWIPEYGQGMLIGANLENANFIDMARMHLTLALHYNSSDFRPALFGSFYTVSGPGRSIISGADPTRRDTPLRDVQRGNSIVFESRILFFERFELWYAFQRYHGVQRLSEYHLRLHFTARNLRLSVAQDRRGLKGFTSLFGELGEENRMRFQFDLRLLGRVWLLMDAHYTYRQNAVIDGNAYYSIQRRFDPAIGLRARF